MSQIALSSKRPLPAAAAVLAVAVLACAVPLSARPSAAPPAQATSVATAPIATLPAVDEFSGVVRAVVQEVKPAVVQITSEQVEIDQFNKPLEIPAGVGSGVIYDDAGHILTNNHVIAGAAKLLVTLPDGRSFPGTLIGADPQTDLAVVKIEGEDLPAARLGDSRRLQVGDWLVAIGNALALPGGPTVTVGVASALGRTVQEPGDSGTAGPFLFDVIQTSAPINPGNSGGPLVNLLGEVVGINTLVAEQTPSGTPVQGIGFAVAVNTAKMIADQLVTSGHAIHPYLGITYLVLNPAIAMQIGAPVHEGVVVRQVTAGSPADQAGLQALDILTQADGTALQGESALAEAINQHQPGDTLALTVLRGGQTLTVSVTLAEHP